jgi:AraC-like DNA-binding protein
MSVDRLPTEDPGRSAPRLSRNVRDALRFLHERAQSAITVQDIADAASLSARGLQKAFQRELGTTPGKYLRVVRLEGVRRELQKAQPSDRRTVAETARRWHFTNPGRMAAEYRALYGTVPSSALRFFEPEDEQPPIAEVAGRAGSRRRFRLVLDCEIDVEDPDAVVASAVRRAALDVSAWNGYRPDGGSEDLVAFVLGNAVRGAVRDTDGIRLRAVNPLLRVPREDGSYDMAELPAWGPVAESPAGPSRVRSNVDQEGTHG